MDDPESEPHEIIFSLEITVDDLDRIALRHETTTFPNIGEVAEFLLKPVLFPTVDSNH
jgi:hypothetical protein